MFSTENRHFSVFSNWRKFPKVIYVISMLSIQPQVFYVSDELTNNILSFWLNLVEFQAFLSHLCVFQAFGSKQSAYVSEKRGKPTEF